MGRALPRGTGLTVGLAVFVELAEYLRCNGDHEESYLVITPDHMVDRTVVSGQIGCPVCKCEYPIVSGAADFRAVETEVPSAAPRRLPTTTPEVVQALLGLTGPGGYIVFIGSASSYAPRLGGVLEGVGFIAINPPSNVEVPASASVLLGTTRIPLRSSMARGVVVGPDMATPAWIDEAVRILLRGLRLIVLAELGELAGVKRLAMEDGLWVGEKT